jgi:hypothetical protein
MLRLNSNNADSWRILFLMAAPEITDIDRLDGGIVVSYSNGMVHFVPASYLWERRNDFQSPIEAFPMPQTPLD